MLYKAHAHHPRSWRGILGLPPSAQVEEANKTYRKLMLVLQPDKRTPQVAHVAANTDAATTAAAVPNEPMHPCMDTRCSWSESFRCDHFDDGVTEQTEYLYQVTRPATLGSGTFLQSSIIVARVVLANSDTLSESEYS